MSECKGCKSTADDLSIFGGDLYCIDCGSGAYKELEAKLSKVESAWQDAELRAEKAEAEFKALRGECSEYEFLVRCNCGKDALRDINNEFESEFGHEFGE